MGPTGDTGSPGDTGPAGPTRSSIDASFQGSDRFIGLVQPSGTTLIRDPRTTPTWNDISGATGYPTGVNGVTLSNMGTGIQVTVHTSTGKVYEADCVVTPTPGTFTNPAWPGNCGTGFVQMSPPNG
ncbi:MAG TPA: hypothetical protein VNW94_01770 [Streptosporangiaceae bacterium]|nr:hypothetical protein [Streptosporangiaceae bacterium]